MLPTQYYKKPVGFFYFCAMTNKSTGEKWAL